MDRQERYQALRDRASVSLKKKHFRQYDFEFEHLSGADSSMSVLEIGCGTGIFLRYLEAKGYRRIVAVDMDAGLAPVLADLKTAQLHFGDVFAIAAEHCPSERFDRIALYDVIEHIDQDALFPFMERLKALLKPDGRIVLRAPNVTSPWGAKMFFDSFDHVTPTTPGRVRELAETTGYTVERVSEQPSQKWRKRLASRLVHGLLEWALPYYPDIWTANFLAVLTPKR